MDWPVLVAGAGPVGLCAALLLARWGVPSVVLDAKPSADVVGSRAICVQRDVLDILERVGCGRTLAAEGVTWTTGRTYYRDHELFAVSFPAGDPTALPPWINISQRSTERHLYDLVERSELVTVCFDHRVRQVRQDASGVEVVAQTRAGPRRLRGSHLIGADGARSAVRERLGIGFPGRSFDDRFLICDIRAELPFPNERRFYFDPTWNPDRQVLVHQCPDSTWRIDWQVPLDFDLDAERAAGLLDVRIRRIVGKVPYEIGWLSVYRFHERCAARMRTGRVFLAGDAAHLFAPFGARGLNSGIQDVDNLAWKLALVRQRRVSSAAAEVLLDSYDTERRAAALENLRVTHATMRFLVPQNERERAWRRAALERAVTQPEARVLIDSGKLAEPFWYLDSPLTTPVEVPGARGDFPRDAGAARPPVPGVLCPDGQCTVPSRPEVTRLRDLFGTGFVVLTARAMRADPPNPPELLNLLELPSLPVPVAGYALSQLDPTGGLAQALQAGADTVHIVRPDGHLAAVLPTFDQAAITTAVRRACGQPTTN